MRVIMGRKKIIVRNATTNTSTSPGAVTNSTTKNDSDGYDNNNNVNNYEGVYRV